MVLLIVDLPCSCAIEPEMRKVYHYFIADDSGMFPAVYSGEPPEESISRLKIIAKGYFRGEGFQILKIYETEKLVSSI